MKRCIIAILLFFVFIINGYAEINDSLNLKAKSAILIEESTGEVIYEYNPDEKLNPASMTKIMSMILIMEKIDSGKLALDENVVVSKEASSMGGSQIYINEGETYIVEELLKGVAIASANDAVVALAEKTYGSKEDFVDAMNERARDLKLQNTNFVNPHGLDDENHYSSARDMSIMARELLKHKSILDYTKKYEDYFRKKDGSSIWLVNTNKLVRFYEGMDGLKTGYTKEAGYCLTATASKNDLRLISVIMGEETIEDRTEDTLKLLNYGFSKIKKELLFDKNKKIDVKKMNMATKDKVDIYLKNDVIKITDKNKDNLKYDYQITYDKKTKLPIKKDQTIGSIIINVNDGTTLKEDLIVKERVNKISFMNQILTNLKTFLTGIK